MVDPFSLVFGLTFAVLGSIFLIGRVDATQLHLQWVAPLPIIALGVLIIALARRREPPASERPFSTSAPARAPREELESVGPPDPPARGEDAQPADGDELDRK